MLEFTTKSSCSLFFFFHILNISELKYTLEPYFENLLPPEVTSVSVRLNKLIHTTKTN